VVEFKTDKEHEDHCLTSFQIQEHQTVIS